RAIAFGGGQRRVEPLKRARSHPQDQLVHILDEIVDRAVGDPDFPRQFPRLQTCQAPRGDASLRHLDQGFSKFSSSFQCFRHFFAKSLSAAQTILERRSNWVYTWFMS